MEINNGYKHKATNRKQKNLCHNIPSGCGKTTLTEKFLLYGGAINTAGSVKGKANSKYAVSDWMDIEKERGISVTSSALQFVMRDTALTY